MTRKVLVNLVVLFSLAPLAAAVNIYVPEDYTTIQGAIDAAADGDTVLVADNTWTGAGNRRIDFGGKSITVQSENGPANCIIDCQWADHAFFFHSGETNSSVLRGFTIKNGYSYFGGAIECAYGSSPFIRDCIIYNNYAIYYGGGIECFESSPEIFNCLFYDNTAAGYGGAIDCEDASPKIYNCTFDKNHAELDGGGIFSSWSSNPDVLSCIFTRCSNHAIYEYPQTLDSDVLVMTSLFYENRIDPCDSQSDLADYYDADTDSSYAGKDGLENMPEPPGEKHIYTVYDNNPLLVRGPASAFVEEPLGEYYLSQEAAGQRAPTSICVDHGQWELFPSGQPNPFFTDPDYTYTTRTDNVGEDTSLDIGFHYRDTGSINYYPLVTEVVEGNGEIDPCHPSPGTAYKEFSQVELTAIPDEGYAVSWWAGATLNWDGGTLNNGDYAGPGWYWIEKERRWVLYPLGITETWVEITEDTTIEVGFQPREAYRLNATVDGAGGQLQTITPPDIDPCSYYEFEYVELQADPCDGYVVKGWTGLEEGLDIISQNMEQVQVLMYADRAVQVEFIADYVELTVIAEPIFGGTVRPRSGRYPYPVPGFDPCEVELTAYPNIYTDPPYRLASWFGTDNDSSTANTNRVTMDQSKTVYAFFEPIPRHLLTIEVLESADGQFHGSVQSLPPSPDDRYFEGTEVQLIPIPDLGYVASEWIGIDPIDPNSPLGYPVVTITGPTTVQVRFRRTNLPGDDPIHVFPGTATGEPDWAAGAKDSDPCTPGIQGYNTIQDAIDAAVSGVAGPYVFEGDDTTDPPLPAIEARPGDVVVVADGPPYTGPGNRDLDFKGKVITVRSEFGPANCIIDAGGTAGDPHRAFVFAGTAPGLGDVVYDAALGVVVPGAENNGSVVDGFTIINGYADFGAGVSVAGVSVPLINNCIIRNNDASSGGGGVYFAGLEEEDTSWDDLATEADAAATEAEEAIADPGTDPNGDPLPPDPAEVAAAQAARLIATVLQQIVDAIGDEEADRATLESCKVNYNKAGEFGPGDGGGIYCLNATPIIMSTEISYNEAGIAPLGLTSFGYGGGVYCMGSVADFVNCLVVWNASSGPGGAMYLEAGSDCIIILSTVAYNNSNTNDLDGIVGLDSSPEISYCIIYHLLGVDLSEVDAEDSWVEDDNLFQSPMFVTGPYGDFYLSQQPFQLVNSPAVDAGEADIFRGAEGLTATYGFLPTVTTKIISDYDYPPTDYGYHYPFYPGPPIKYTLIMHVIGNGTLDYSAQDIYVYPPVSTSGTVDPCVPPYYGSYTASPGTVVTLIANPDPGYRVYEWVGADIDPSFSTTNSFTMATENVGPDNVAHVFVYFEEIFTSSIHVPGDYAYNEIQNAIDAARYGDTIVLAPGTYPGTGYLVWGKNITITAEFPTERNNPALATVIDCSGESDGGFHLIGAGLGSSILNGLVIQTSTWVRATDGLNGDDIEDNIPGTPGRPGGTDDPGGLPGLFWSGLIGIVGHYEAFLPAYGITIFGNHEVVNCTVRGFTIRGGNGGDGQDGGEYGDPPSLINGGYGGDGGSSMGAGIFVGSYLGRSTPLIKDCVIEDCTVIAGNGGNGGAGPDPAGDGGRGGVAGTAAGAGIYCETNTSPTFKNCVVQNCRAIGGYGGNGGDSGPDGGWGGYGGLTIYDPCQPQPDSRTARGAGVYCETDSSASFEHCIIQNNFADGSVSGLGGIDVFGNYQSQPRYNYKIPGYGAGVFCEGDSETIFTKNCIIRNNEAQYGYGVGIPVDWLDPTTVPELVEFGGTTYTGYGGGICAEGIIYYYILKPPPVILPTLFGPRWSQSHTFWSEVDSAVATFTDCKITDNSSAIGGGIYSYGSYIDISNCDFIENSSYLGGGLFSTYGQANIFGCKIRDNIASIQAGVAEPPAEPEPPEPGAEPEAVGALGQLGIGGGLFWFTTDGVISDSVITGNFADVSGGGVYLAGEPGTLTRWNMAATPELNNCLITDNMAGESGGGVACNISVQAQIRNCTIANNLATDPNSYGGGIYCTYGSIVDVNDSILWANNADYGAQLAIDGFWIDVNDISLDTYLSKVNIRYSDIAGPADANFSFGGASGAISQTGGPFLVEPETIYGQFDAGQAMVDVIVSLKEPAIRQATNWSDSISVNTLRTEIFALQNTVLGALAVSQFTLRHQFENQAGFSGLITLDGLDVLLGNPLVYAIEPVRYFDRMLAQAIPLANALNTRDTYDGSGAAIAIVDTGVDYTHPMLGGGGFPNTKVIGGYDTANNDPDPIPVDEAHGTACAGIAAGDLGMVGDYIGGVAPGAKIYALKAALDGEGSFATDDLVEAWNWCITHQYDDPANPIMVISNSLGGSFPYNDPAQADADFPSLAIAASTAVSNSIIILAASGNNGYAGTGISAPAAMSDVVSVGAVYDTTDQVTEYSNTAEILDILAPADPVYTTDIVGPDGYDPGDYFPYFNGTSSACPFAAGAVAGLQSAALAKMGNYLSPAKVRDILVTTGDPITDTKVNITKPRVNLGVAINSLSFGPLVWVSDGCRLNGRVFYDFDPNTFVWYPAAHNIEEDPLFVDDYFLSQTNAGQSADSNCVDAGSDLAKNLGMHKYTTRTDGGPDEGRVDMGYHHPSFRRPVSIEPCSYADLFPIPSLGEGRDYGDGIVDLDYIFVLASYWLNDCPYRPECEYADITSDGFVNIEDFGYFAGRCWLGEYSQDNVGPEPAEWEKVPRAVSSTSIAMTARAAFDSWGWNVEYQFESSVDPCSSGWQELNPWGPVRTYRDDGLVTGQQYWYRFKVRDMSPDPCNISYSEILSATPVIDTDPPSPDPMTWAIVPYATGASSISMTATTATDPSGVEYYFEETGGSTSGWQNGTSWTDSGLSVSTQYCYRVRARDKSPNQNETAWSTPPACAITGGTGGNLPPYPDGGFPGDPATWDPDEVNGWSGQPRAVAGGHYMRADEAIDPEGLGVEYYFTCTTGEVADSGWQTSREWLVGAPAGTHYCYSVKYRDTSPQQVESGSSSTVCVP